MPKVDMSPVPKIDLKALYFLIHTFKSPAGVVIGSGSSISPVDVYHEENTFCYPVSLISQQSTLSLIQCEIKLQANIHSHLQITTCVAGPVCISAAMDIVKV